MAVYLPNALVWAIASYFDYTISIFKIKCCSLNQHLIYTQKSPVAIDL